jgi:hypothetical protein
VAEPKSLGLQPAAARVPVVNRPALFGLACGVVLGGVVGRLLPRATPAPTAQPAAAPTLAAPSACAERTQLASMRAQLAVCNARLARALSPDAGAAESPAPELTLASPNLPSMLPGLPTVGPLPPASEPPSIDEVMVRHKDGTVSSHPLKDWPRDADEGTIIARSYAGHWGFFAPDAGPDGVEIPLGDLAGADGTIHVGATRIRFPRRRDGDAGGP